MGHLADEITRLCSEIQLLRNTRETMMKDLSQGIMELKNNVAAMRGRFRKSHADMTINARAERMAFNSSIKESVGAIRNEVATDITTARRGWFGFIPTKPIAMEVNNKRLEKEPGSQPPEVDSKDQERNKFRSNELRAKQEEEELLIHEAEAETKKDEGTENELEINLQAQSEKEDEMEQEERIFPSLGIKPKGKKKRQL